MMKLCIFGGSLVGGYVAGYMVSSYGMMAEVIVSGIGSMVGRLPGLEARPAHRTRTEAGAFSRAPRGP